MSDRQRNEGTSLADFIAGWRTALEDHEWINVTYAARTR
jgi:hypothetical protein